MPHGFVSRRVAVCTIVLVLAFAFVPALALAAPVVLYTDIVTGPNTGGEGGNGAYLTLFGRGFGASQGDSQVTINNVPVAAYKQWSDTKITVQPGPNVTSGAIKITVGSESYSDPAITFTVVRGNIYFVALNGSDSGRVGNINRPFRSIQNTLDRSDFGPGDHLVIRGGEWTDAYDKYKSFFSIHHKSGTAAAPFAIMGYPGETVTLFRKENSGVTRAVHSYATEGHYVIANLHVNMNNGGSTCIGIAPGTRNVRIVNNEGQGMFEDSGGSACIAGSGKGYRILGNHIHHNSGSKLYHALYFDGRDRSGPDDIEIAYNHIHHQTGGRGVQIYGDTGTPITNVRVHHNLIHDIALDGIIFSRDSAEGFQAYNNVVFRTAVAELRGPSTDRGGSGGCIRFASAELVAEVYNNTFVDCAVDNDPESGAIRFERASKLTLRNNIVIGKYTNNSPPPEIVSSHNLWYGSGTPPGWDSNSISADPRFVAAPAADYRLLPASPAIDRGSSAVGNVVTNDYDGNRRPQGRTHDVGAFESIRVSVPRADASAVTQKK